MGTLRADIADIAQRLQDAEQRAEQLPHREKYLRLVNGFLRRLLDLHMDLVDEVERELAPGAAAQSAAPGSSRSFRPGTGQGDSLEG
jgi:hypothetical protein